MNIQNMIDRLKEVSDEAWGYYILKRDVLYNRIKEEEMPEMIEKSIECGIEYAKLVKEEHEITSIEKLVYDLGLKVTESETKPGTKRLTFAVFTTPNHITIMNTPLRQVNEDIKLLRKEDQKVFGGSRLRDLLLAHETFHYVEEKNKSDIYTRNRRIQLWNILGWKNTSTLRSLSEIAGMYFAKEITGFPYCPMMLDVILFYPFSPDSAQGIFNTIVGIDERLKKGERP